MKRLFLLLAVLILSGCGLAQSHCLAPCLDKAIEAHTADRPEKHREGLTELGTCTIDSMEYAVRDIELLTASGLCKVRCQ